MTTKPLPKFTMDDLLTELQAKMPEFNQGDAYTTTDMAGAISVSETTMRRMLKQLKAAGLVRVAKKQIMAINDRLMTVTAWMVAPKTT